MTQTRDPFIILMRDLALVHAGSIPYEDIFYGRLFYIYRTLLNVVKVSKGIDVNIVDMLHTENNNNNSYYY